MDIQGLLLWLLMVGSFGDWERSAGAGCLSPSHDLRPQRDIGHAYAESLEQRDVCARTQDIDPLVNERLETAHVGPVQRSGVRGHAKLTGVITRLLDGVGDDQSASRYGTLIKFTARRDDRPYGVDVHPISDLRSGKHRVGRPRDGGYDVGALDRLVDRRVTADPYVELSLKRLSECQSAARVTAEDADLGDRSDGGDRSRLGERLLPGSQHRRSRGVFPGQHPRPEPRSGGGTHLPEREGLNDAEQRPGDCADLRAPAAEALRRGVAPEVGGDGEEGEEE